MKKTLAALALTASIASADRIVVNNDEWTFSGTGFGAAVGTTQFARNVASWLTAENGDMDILIYSTNFGVADGSLGNALTSAGYNVTYANPNLNPSVNLSNYGAVFLAGNAVNNADLVTYVNNGGGVYLAGGTGEGGAAAEAARWNPFLNTFGLGFGTFYNGVGGALAAPASHTILSGVSNVYFNNGNNAIDLVAGGNSQVIWSQGNNGLLAVYDGPGTAAVPEPGTVALMGLGLGALGFAARRRKK